MALTPAEKQRRYRARLKIKHDEMELQAGANASLSNLLPIQIQSELNKLNARNATLVTVHDFSAYLTSHDIDFLIGADAETLQTLSELKEFMNETVAAMFNNVELWPDMTRAELNELIGASIENPLVEPPAIRAELLRNSFLETVSKSEKINYAKNQHMFRRWFSTETAERERLEQLNQKKLQREKSKKPKRFSAPDRDKPIEPMPFPAPESPPEIRRVDNVISVDFSKKSRN